jgi:hypothetical protein
MYFNPKYGNFGMLVLPFGFSAFFLGLYASAYSIFTMLQYVSDVVLNRWATHVPFTLHLQAPHLDWFYLNTSMMTLMIVAVMGSTITAILIGNRIVEGRLSPLSFVSYFMLYGLVVPVWLARALWGAARSRPASWR